MDDKERAERFDNWLDDQDSDTIKTANKHLKTLMTLRDMGDISAKSFYSKFVLFLDDEGELR